MSSTPYAPNAQKSPGWLSRNWIWLVPVGCLGAIAALIAFVGLIVAVIFGAMKMADPYQDAMARAQAHPEVVSELGEPITEGWFISGNINVNGPTGQANLAIPVSGPEGSGTIYVEGEKRAGTWDYDVMEIQIDGRADRISLLDSDVVELRHPEALTEGLVATAAAC